MAGQSIELEIKEEELVDPETQRAFYGLVRELVVREKRFRYLYKNV